MARSFMTASDIDRPFSTLLDSGDCGTPGSAEDSTSLRPGNSHDQGDDAHDPSFSTYNRAVAARGTPSMIIRNRLVFPFAGLLLASASGCYAADTGYDFII